jgi:hypothetical protein
MLPQGRGQPRPAGKTPGWGSNPATPLYYVPWYPGYELNHVLGKASATSGGDVTWSTAWLDSALCAHGARGRRGQTARTIIVPLTRETWALSSTILSRALHRSQDAHATLSSCAAASVALAAGPPHTHKSSTHSNSHDNDMPILHEATVRAKARRSVPTEEVLPLYTVAAGGEASVAG